MRRTSWLILAMLLPLSGAAVPSRASGGGPELTTPVAQLDAALSCPQQFSHADRDPVLLVHGATVTAEESWGWNYLRALPAEGYDVCTVAQPRRGLGDIQISAEYIVHAVRSMAARSGRKVDIVTHSEGGLVPRWAVKWWPDVAESVDDVIGLASPNHGTLVGDASCLQRCAPSFWQFRTAAAFIAALNAGDETPGLISYTSIYSLVDQFVVEAGTPPTSAIDGASNIAVQDICPGRPVDHVSELYDAVVYAIVLDALRHDGPADPFRVDRGACGRLFVPGVTAEEVVVATVVLYSVIIPQFLILDDADRTDHEPALADYARNHR